MSTLKLKEELLSLQESGFFKNLCIKRGIEREALRVDINGRVSQRTHPGKLGSPLTNPNVTTDFSEALMELVTPTFESPKDLFHHLSDLHGFAYSAMDDEILWNFSMPCPFDGEDEIRLAEYGTSNSGQLKHIYRKGLKLRYGSIMQCVAGIHYNFSITESSWDAFNKNKTQQDIDNKYLGLIRNIKRNAWFLFGHFGASPVTHQSYLLGRAHNLEVLGQDDLFMPNATTLRMSDIGYQSAVQESLKLRYNTLPGFINAIKTGIATSHDPFKNLGLFDADGAPQQISTGILQIENELYDIVRPKRTGKSGERPSQLLQQHGIEYVELRGLDVNPFVPEGISENQIKLLDVFLMHGLLSDSPLITDEENQNMQRNHKVMVLDGRSEDLQLIQDGKPSNLDSVKKAYLEELKMIASAMDAYQPGYTEALESEIAIKPSISQKILDEMNVKNQSFKEYGFEKSAAAAKKFLGCKYEDYPEFGSMAKRSVEELKNIEKIEDIDINKYVELYNSKLKEEL